MKQRNDWIAQAVTALRQGGVDAVRVEPLARALGVTKGSFYWHFADRSELLEALLALWERETDWLVVEAASAADPPARVRRFFELVVKAEGYPPDAAIFAWAAHDTAVARRAEATEGRRIAFLREQLEAHGVGPAESARRADISYLASLGWIERASRVAVMEQELSSLMDYLMALLMGPSAAGGEA